MTAAAASRASRRKPVAAEVAAAAFRAVAAVLAAGAQASGPFAQAELLRSIHACRSEGLHRLAAAETRVLRSIRDLFADRPEFALAALAADLRDALAVADALAAGDSDPALLGTARRGYAPIGGLRLHGVCAEAIVARSGYAGAITYLADERGALYTRADVAPGDAAYAVAAYDMPAAFGEVVLPPRVLSRGRLLVESATASADGRLGSGRRVRATRVAQPARWDQAPIDARFRAPFAGQLAQIAARDAEPADARPAGWDLAFVEGVLVGGAAGVFVHVPRAAAADAAAADAEPGAEPALMLRLATAHHRGLPGGDNLVALSRGTGLAVRAIGRVRIGEPRELHLIAIGPAPGERRLALPAPWHGRANVHYDRIPLSAIPDRDARAPAAPPGPPGDDLLAPLRRRIERAALGGAGTLPAQAQDELEREAAALAARALGGAAEVLRDLAALAHAAAPRRAAPADDAAPAAHRAPDRAAFARAWLRAAVYEDAARRRLSLASW
ncbi:MAG TPA: hypothetical protein VNO30_32700 [Kofleriaceae bacterium]|nr:hypothetical protein [Kofleriaceae bacterium]